MGFIERKNLLEMSSWVAGLVGFVVAALSFFIAAPEKKIETQHPIVLSTPSAANTDLAKLKTEFNEFRNALAKVEATPHNPKIGIQLAQLQSTLAGVQARQEKLEQIFLNNPSKALELPLLQRDVEALKLMQQTNAASLKDSVDRVYDLNKWLLGGLAISVISLALANLLKVRVPQRRGRRIERQQNAQPIIREGEPRSGLPLNLTLDPS